MAKIYCGEEFDCSYCENNDDEDYEQCIECSKHICNDCIDIKENCVTYADHSNYCTICIECFMESCSDKYLVSIKDDGVIFLKEKAPAIKSAMKR